MTKKTNGGRSVLAISPSLKATSESWDLVRNYLIAMAQRRREEMRRPSKHDWCLIIQWWKKAASQGHVAAQLNGHPRVTLRICVPLFVSLLKPSTEWPALADPSPRSDIPSAKVC
jgi:hypothetical protein